MTDILKSRMFFIVIMLLLTFLYLNEKLHNGKVVEDVTRNAQILNQEARKWKDEAGKWRAEANTVNGDLNTVKITHKQELDKLAKDFDTKIKNIKSSTTTETITKVNYIDSVVYTNEEGKPLSFKFERKDLWNDIFVGYNAGMIDIDIAVRDSVSFVTKWERKNIFSKKNLVTQAVSHNPNTQITGLNSLNVSEPYKTRFGVGPYFGVGIGANMKIQPQIGVGISYHLIRF